MQYVNARQFAFFAIRIFGAMSFVCLLGGCEKLEMGPWEAAGSAEVPGPFDPKKQEFRIVPLTTGVGPEIKPGSLVSAKIIYKPVIPKNSDLPACGGEVRFGCYLLEEKTYDVWFWVGREKVDRGLGTYPLRAAFIGARAGARLSLILNGTPKKFVKITLPKRVFLLPYALSPEGTWFSQYDEDLVEMSGNDEKRYDFEILRVCEGRLLQKRGVLTQRNVYMHIFGGGPLFSYERQGPLEWMAMEATCESPKETIRFEKGPAADPRQGNLDGLWPKYYKKALEK